MSATLREPYLVRPTAEIAKRFGDAWFGRAAIWYVREVPRPDGDDPPEHLKLHILGRIYDDAHDEHQARVGTTSGADDLAQKFAEARRANAIEFLADAPLDVATFDRCWTIERVDVGGDCETEWLSSAALAATGLDAYFVRGAASAIEQRAVLEARALAALREAISKLFVVYADDLPTRAWVAMGSTPYLPPRYKMNELLDELGCVSSGSPVLHVRLEPGEPNSAFALLGLRRARVSFHVTFKRTTAAPRKRMRRGHVELELDSEPGSARIVSAALVTEERVQL